MNKKIIIYTFIYAFLIPLLGACQEDIKKNGEYKRGNLTISIDPSFLNLGTALADVFQADYPEAKITFKPEVEDLAVVDFVNAKRTIVIVSRDLTQEEAEILKNKTGVTHIATQIACDATIFITSKESTRDRVSLSEIKSGVSDSNSIFVFDNGNSSNYNTVKQKINLKLAENEKITALTDAYKVIDFVSANKSYIGIIGLDILSDEDDPEIKKLLSKIKIIPVVNEKGEAVYPTIPNLRESIYPFTKRVFFLNAEGRFFIGSAFVKFIASQRGQLIVTKAGLQPYFLYQRRVEMK